MYVVYADTKFSWRRVRDLKLTLINTLFYFYSVHRGGDVPKLEPIRGLHYSRVDKIVRDLRRIYKDNPASFDVPAFAQKVY